MEDDTSFNIALWPDDESLLQECIRLAQLNCSEIADQYLIGDHACPHVTLCQINAETDELENIWAAIQSVHPKQLSLSFNQFYIKPGQNELEGYYWVGVGVRRAAEIINLQKTIYDQLLSLNLESRNKPLGYTPHLTWARCKGDSPQPIKYFPSNEFWSKSYTFSLSLGRSDKHGVYHERLFSL